MFTGIVQQLGTVESIGRQDGGARLRVAAQLAGSLSNGESVLVNGVCLTAVDTTDGNFEADLSPETIDRSALAELAVGDHVHLELPLRAEDRLGGHIVQGHVDAVAQITAVTDAGGARNLRVEAPQHVLRYVVEKGSIALDGVSLTVTGADERGFGVALIPETLERTTFDQASPGRRVNLEVDILAKYVEKLAQPVVERKT